MKRIFSQEEKLRVAVNPADRLRDLFPTASLADDPIADSSLSPLVVLLPLRKEFRLRGPLDLLSQSLDNA